MDEKADVSETIAVEILDEYSTRLDSSTSAGEGFLLKDREAESWDK
tara:strand:- start:37 stop:174 length:138 start_codon:yes stop_codon:yes gene_type:complete